MEDPAAENYIAGGYNTYNKRPWKPDELLELPHFGGSVRMRLEMRRKGRDVPTYGLKVDEGHFKTTGGKSGPNNRKLIILPAKPPPRKTQSVIRNNSKDTIEQAHRSPRLNSTLANKRTADSGIYEELNRIKQTTDAFNNSGRFSQTVRKDKNQSTEAKALIQHKPMNDYVSVCKASDKDSFIGSNLNKRRPIFKHFIHNNTSILRTELQHKRLQKIFDD